MKNKILKRRHKNRDFRTQLDRKAALRELAGFRKALARLPDNIVSDIENPVLNLDLEGLADMFSGFYGDALERIKLICEQNGIDFDAVETRANV